MARINLNTVSTVSEKIVELAKEKNINFMEACVEYSEIHNMDIEYLGEVLKKNQKIKAKIQLEAEDLNFLKKTSRIKND